MVEGLSENESEAAMACPAVQRFMDCAAEQSCCEAVKPIHDMVQDVCNGTKQFVNPCDKRHIDKLKFPMPNASCASINQTRKCFDDMVGMVEGLSENESEAAMACPAVQRFMDCAAEQSCCEAVKPIHDMVKDICNDTKNVTNTCQEDHLGKLKFPMPNASCASINETRRCFEDLIAVVEGPPENESEAAMACPAVQRFMDCAVEQSCCEAVKPIHDMIKDICNNTKNVTNTCQEDHLGKLKFPTPNASCASINETRKCFEDLIAVVECALRT
eukprot:TRINITY_DN8319_c0_g1_i17.p1 TRINITY_DN8319_c0_g1~~TRINITY_DN8319_c0_g1_i17.p1  ORF type:complete len:313 (-),score=74.33 TRINITY_DN8319_c0_g1_i17:900-1718(-)